MNLIIETDLGHDPDDWFALCWLAAVGVNIRAVVIVPGDPDQVSVASFLRKRLGLDFLIGASKLGRLVKHPAWSVHQEILERYDAPQEAQPDGPGVEIVEQVHKAYPDSEFFVIGPVSSVGRYFRDHPDIKVQKATMQGGFLGYDLHQYPCQRLPKFEGQIWQPTFNLNGDRPAGLWFMTANIAERRFVPKSLTHSVIYNGERHAMCDPINEASRLFQESMNIYLGKHPEKKFHDPVAAVCHIKPEIASWVRGKIVKMESGWGTVLDDNGDYIAADIDRDKFWNCILRFKL